MPDWLINEENFDLTKKKTFFNPIPKFIGGKIPFPDNAKSVCDILDGKILPLSEALQKIKAEHNNPSDKFLLLRKDLDYGGGIIFLCLGQDKDKGVIISFPLICFSNP